VRRLDEYGRQRIDELLFRDLGHVDLPPDDARGWGPAASTRGRVFPMTDTKTEVVLYDVSDGIATLTLNRPDRLNAWTGGLARRYYSLLEQAASDDDVRVIVVTGAGKGWCAGADMESLQGNAEVDDSDAGLDRPIWFPTTVPKPIIAAINGACAGIGLCAALMCDLRFAAAGAKFTTAFVRRGLIAEHGSSWALPRLIGHAAALDLLFSGRVFLAEEAKDLGVVNQVFAPDELIAKTREYATDLIEHCSPKSMATIKAEIYRHWELDVATATREANQLMTRSFAFPDFREGVQSFVQKRNPDFEPLPTDYEVLPNDWK
jgi:enoyl-CoA hydratase/carnithine racemase